MWWQQRIKNNKRKTFCKFQLKTLRIVWLINKNRFFVIFEVNESLFFSFPKNNTRLILNKQKRKKKVDPQITSFTQTTQITHLRSAPQSMRAHQFDVRPRDGEDQCGTIRSCGDLTEGPTPWRRGLYRRLHFVSREEWREVGPPETWNMGVVA